MIKSKLLFLLLLLGTIARVNGQQLPFYKDILEFKSQDSAQFPPKNAILFIGSSSFTKWKTVMEDFPGYTIINRGFGGSTISDQLLYVNQIITPYQPKQIVIYCGENDIAFSDTITVQAVYNRFVRLFNVVREQVPGVSIVFVSIKPSPSRAKYDAKVKATNELIRNYLGTQTSTAYVDVYHAMLNKDGKPRPELFVGDMLHMNPDGYAIWQKEIAPFLLK